MPYQSQILTALKGTALVLLCLSLAGANTLAGVSNNRVATSHKGTTPLLVNYIPLSDAEEARLAAELAACQRYYYRQQALTTAEAFCGGTMTSGTNLTAIFPFPVVMRAIPTAVENAGTFATNYSVRSGATLAVSSLALSGATGVRNAILDVTVAGGALGDAAFFRAATLAAYLGFSAEL